MKYNWGVYIIQSISHPDRVYVGSSINLKYRKYTHFYQLKNKKHGSSKLQNHYNKYGKDDLVFEIIEIGDYINETHLFSREQGWFTHFKHKNRELPYFNHRPIAETNLTIKQSKSSSKKKSKIMKELWSDPSYYNKMIDSFKNKETSPEITESKSIAMKQVWSNPEYKQARIDWLNENQPRKGTQHKKETIEKYLVDRNNPEYIQYMSEMMKKEWIDPLKREKRLKSAQSRPDRICEYCGKLCKAMDYGIYHGEKCKDKPILNYDDCLCGQISVSKQSI
jgi:group I intron endonuclease